MVSYDYGQRIKATKWLNSIFELLRKGDIDHVSIPKIRHELSMTFPVPPGIVKQFVNDWLAIHEDYIQLENEIVPVPKAQTLSRQDKKTPEEEDKNDQD